MGSGVGTADLDEDGFLDIFHNRTFYTGGEQITESDRIIYCSTKEIKIIG